MASIQMKGLDKYTEALSQLALDLKGKVIGPAIYDAADIAADAIRAEMDTLPTSGGLGPPEGPTMLKGPNKKQKEALLSSFGISKMQNDMGFYNVHLGFTGYNDIVTKSWPKGQPNVMVARSVERGTSFMEATPFIKRAMSQARKKALEAMRTSVDQSLKEAMTK